MEAGGPCGTSETGEASRQREDKSMKRQIAVLIACAFTLGAALPAQATGAKPNDRFANTEPLEPMARSRSDAAEAAAQVPGAACSRHCAIAASPPANSACRLNCGAPIS